MARKTVEKKQVRRAKGTRHEFVFDEETEMILSEVTSRDGINASEAVRRGLGLYRQLVDGAPKMQELLGKVEKARRLGEQLVAVTSS